MRMCRRQSHTAAWRRHDVGKDPPRATPARLNPLLDSRLLSTRSRPPRMVACDSAADRRPIAIAPVWPSRCRPPVPRFPSPPSFFFPVSCLARLQARSFFSVEPASRCTRLCARATRGARSTPAGQSEEQFRQSRAGSNPADDDRVERNAEHAARSAFFLRRPVRKKLGIWSLSVCLCHDHRCEAPWKCLAKKIGGAGLFLGGSLDQST